MLAFLAYLVGLLVVGGLLFLAASFVFGRGEEMAQVPVGGTPVELPDDRPVAAADVRALRFSVVLRGYRMDEVDWVLGQLADQLADRDRELAELRREAEPEPGPVEPADTGAELPAAELAAAELTAAEAPPEEAAAAAPPEEATAAQATAQATAAQTPAADRPAPAEHRG